MFSWGWTPKEGSQSGRKTKGTRGFNDASTESLPPLNHVAMHQGNSIKKVKQKKNLNLSLSINQSINQASILSIQKQKKSKLRNRLNNLTPTPPPSLPQPLSKLPTPFLPKRSRNCQSSSAVGVDGGGGGREKKES